MDVSSIKIIYNSHSKLTCRLFNEVWVIFYFTFSFGHGFQGLGHVIQLEFVSKMNLCLIEFDWTHSLGFDTNNIRCGQSFLLYELFVSYPIFWVATSVNFVNENYAFFL